jgi:hypothetical protein
MQTLTIPSISRESAGLLMFDMKPFGYSYDYAYKFLYQLSDKGYELYKYVQLPLDVLFPILNCITALCTFTLLVSLYTKVKDKSELKINSSFSKAILWLPLIAMLLDYMENITILMMLLYKTATPKFLVYTANIFTITKSVSTSVFYIIVVIICAFICGIWICNRIKEEQTNGKLRSKREEDRTSEDVNAGRNASTTKSEGA